MALSDVTEEDIKSILDEALRRPISDKYDSYMEMSAISMKEGLRGGEAWAMDLIKMLAITVAKCRKS